MAEITPHGIKRLWGRGSLHVISIREITPGYQLFFKNALFKFNMTNDAVVQFGSVPGGESVRSRPKNKPSFFILNIRVQPGE
jgi:hypothetical protein